MYTAQKSRGFFNILQNPNKIKLKCIYFQFLYIMLIFMSTLLCKLAKPIVYNYTLINEYHYI